MNSREDAARRYRFGTFEADTQAGELWKAGARVAIQEQPFKLLAYLLLRPDRVVTRDELRAALWSSDTFVDFEQGLNAAVRRLRDALGDSAESPRFIETLPKRGYRFIAPVVPPDTSAEERPPHAAAYVRPRGGYLRPWPVGLVVLVTAIAVTVVWFALARADDPSHIRLSDPVQITSGTGAEGWATWSPDGRMLAYASDATGNWDVWVTQVDGGQAVNRTRDHAGRDNSPSWSPDGNQIAFLTVRDETSAVYVMSPLAGAPRKVAGPAFGIPQWSPDGTELAYLLPTPPRTTVEIVSVVSGAIRRVDLHVPEFSAMNLKWSRDGRFFAYTTGAGTATLVSQVWVLRLADNQVFPVTDGLNNDREPAWAADGRSLFFVSDRTGTTDLWRQRLEADGAPTGAPEAVTAGVGARASEFSRDGQSVAYTTGRLIANLWRVPIFT